MQFTYNDGGRAEAGYKGQTGDCVVRAIAIATNQSYKAVYDDLNELAKTERVTKKMRRGSNSRTGVHRKTYEVYLKGHGWRWVATMLIGQGCKIHLTEDELPQGRLIVRLSKHLTAIVDKVINDIYDPSRGGARCVYGYFIKE